MQSVKSITPPDNSVTSMSLNGEIPDISLEFYMQFPMDFLNSPLGSELNNQQAYVLNQQPPDPAPQNQTVVLDPPDLSWWVSNMILNEQRALVADTSGRIVV